MIQFLTMVSAAFVGFLLIGGLLAVLPKRKPVLSCAFCGHEAHSLYGVVEHVKRCDKHPLRRELDYARDLVKVLTEQRDEIRTEIESMFKMQRELDAWWAIAKAVLENPDNNLCDESRKLLEGVVKEGER